MPSTNWIQTFTGRQVWPLEPEEPANAFCIEDIAHALSQTCRFSGHTRKFYSVAEHCVLGSFLVPEEMALLFLLHDAAEAYLGDVVRPIKRSLWLRNGHPGEADEFSAIEDRLHSAILKSLEIRMPSTWSCDVISRFDVQMLVAEASELFDGGLHPDWSVQPKFGFPPADVILGCWSPEQAKKKFLERWHTLPHC